MENAEGKRFNMRRFVVLTAIVTGLGLPFSGLANHLLQLEPIFSAARHAWMAAHTMLGILFTLSVLSHAVFNRRMLLAYVRGQAARPGTGREAAGAIALVAVMLFVAVGHAVH